MTEDEEAMKEDKPAGDAPTIEEVDEEAEPKRKKTKKVKEVQG